MKINLVPRRLVVTKEPKELCFEDKELDILVILEKQEKTGVFSKHYPDGKVNFRGKLYFRINKIFPEGEFYYLFYIWDVAPDDYEEDMNIRVKELLFKRQIKLEQTKGRTEKILRGIEYLPSDPEDIKKYNKNLEEITKELERYM